MAQLNERNSELAEYFLSENELKRLHSLGYDEASWRIEHEYQVHCDWARKKRDFMLMEMRSLLPVGELPPTVGPPIMRHGNRNGNRSHVHGEQFG